MRKAIDVLILISLLGALAAIILIVPGPKSAAALCTALLALGLGALWASTGGGRREATAGAKRRLLPGLFTVLWVGAFATVCYLSLASGAGLLHRGLFLLSLPVVLPSCALLALALLPRSPRLRARPMELGAQVPLVTLILATRNEPFSVVKMTLDSALALAYPAQRLELIVTDNSDLSHPDLAPLREHLDQLARDRSVRFLHRDGKEGAKARNLDLALAQVTGDYILLLDADSTLAPDSLQLAIGHMEQHPRTAHVQLRIGTSNWQRNAFTLCSSYMTDVVIRGVEELRSSLGFSFNGGHNVVWRRSALNEVAPFEQYFDGVLCQTEDYSASIRAALRGWRCETLGIDSWEWAPFDVRSYLKQWYRWGYGAQQGVLQYGRAVLRSDRVSYGGKVAMLIGFLHFLSPFFTLSCTLWLSLVSVWGTGAPSGPGCVVYGLTAGSLAVFLLFCRSAPSHAGVGWLKRLAAMIIAGVVLLGLTTWVTMLSMFANLARRELVWTVTAKS